VDDNIATLMAAVEIIGGLFIAAMFAAFFILKRRVKKAKALEKSQTD
jgi:uncharacterized membrane protein YciS (DUF1049 family)